MIRALILVILIAALAFAGQWLIANPGTIGFTWLGYRVQTSIVIAAAALAILVVILMTLWNLVGVIFRTPRRMAQAAQLRRRNKGYEALSRGMIAVGAGDGGTARREAAEAARLLKHEPMTLLLSAQAAQLSGDRPAARALFEQMAQRADTRALGLRGLYIEARRAGEHDEAFRYAEAAQQAAPLPWAGQALIERHALENDWAATLAAVERAGAGGQIDKQELARERAALKTAIALDCAEKESDRALALAKEALSDQPDLVPAAALAARLYGRGGDLKKGSKIVEAIWPNAAHPDLAQAYVDLRSGDSSLDRLARARKLAKLSPNDPESRLMVADVATAAREFREAREALEPLVADDRRPTQRVAAAMARLEEAEGHAAKAREWWGRAARSPRDKAWIADGMIFESWGPVAPQSGAIGVFEWKTPDERLAPPVDLPDAIFEPDAAAAPALIEVEAAPVKAEPEPVKATAPDKTQRTVVFPLPSAPDDPGVRG